MSTMTERCIGLLRIQVQPDGKEVLQQAWMIEEHSSGVLRSSRQEFRSIPRVDARGQPIADPAGGERLIGVAIMRGGEYSGSLNGNLLKSHYELRLMMGDKEPQRSKLNDVEGFVTSSGRFVTREEAVPIGLAAGQLHDSWWVALRKLLSSDIKW